MADVDVATKTCPHCHLTLPLDGFHRHRGARDGRQSWCRACMNETTRVHRQQRRAENPDAVRRADREAVARYRAENPDYRERNVAMNNARVAAQRRLAKACPAEFAAIHQRILKERGLTP